MGSSAAGAKPTPTPTPTPLKDAMDQTLRVLNPLNLPQTLSAMQAETTQALSAVPSALSDMVAAVAHVGAGAAAPSPPPRYVGRPQPPPRANRPAPLPPVIPPPPTASALPRPTVARPPPVEQPPQPPPRRSVVRL